MFNSKLRNTKYISLPGTENTGKTTFTLNGYYLAYIFVSAEVIGVIRRDSNTARPTVLLIGNTNANYTIGEDYSITITGLAWWDFPYLTLPQFQ